uniref:CHHC U11-48K-type domain-containing protein n=1 Tax=Eutreptiella gymnastica TaxID=73025 RepID=A0A7S4CV87_9EUGL|mmetsp:Transcript_99052/g.166898  ORF Transcript_99052/g.166898 Transcript_99052/m.166898 type:complete len:593 (+) Transcript_99052:87-1865(+)
MLTDLSTLQQGYYRLVLQRCNTPQGNEWEEVWKVQWNVGHADKGSADEGAGGATSELDEEQHFEKESDIKSPVDDKPKMKGGLDMFFASRPGFAKLAGDGASSANAAGGKMYRCPFDHTHQVPRGDIVPHVKTCSSSPMVNKQAALSGNSLVNCPYNPAHRMPAKSILRHMNRCPSCPTGPLDGPATCPVVPTTEKPERTPGGLDMFLAANSQIKSSTTPADAGPKDAQTPNDAAATPTERVLPCPLDRSHLVPASEMVAHMKTCPARAVVGDNASVPCPFNHSHVMALKTLLRHMVKCSSGPGEAAMLGKKDKNKNLKTKDKNARNRLGVRDGPYGHHRGHWEQAYLPPRGAYNMEPAAFGADGSGFSPDGAFVQDGAYSQNFVAQYGLDLGYGAAGILQDQQAYLQQMYQQPPAAVDPQEALGAVAVAVAVDGDVAAPVEVAAPAAAPAVAEAEVVEEEDEIVVPVQPEAQATPEAAATPLESDSVLGPGPVSTGTPGQQGPAWYPQQAQGNAVKGPKSLCCCPFDAAHRVPGYMLLAHLKTCSASPMVAPQPMMRQDTVISCPFNPNHRMPAHAISRHIAWCPSILEHS